MQRPMESRPSISCTYSFSFISLIGILFFLLLFVPPTHAQDSAGLRIAPSIIEDRIEPGDSFSGTIRVTNLESITRTFYIVLRDIKSIGPGGQPIFAEEGEPTGFELSEWITPSVNEITLDSDEEGSFDFTVRVPGNASPGGHFGGIFLSAEPERQRSTGAGIGYQVGTIMNFRIGGNIIENADIREFFTDKLLYSVPEVVFTAEVENEGNVLIRPRGPISITDMFGRNVATIRMNNDGAAVLPNSRRTFTVSWQGEGPHFGRYEAIVGLIYGEDARQTMSAAVSFWILPLRIILPLVGGILLLILVVYLMVRMYLKRRIDEMYRHSRQLSRRDMKGVRRTALEGQGRAPIPKVAVVAIAVLAFTMIFLAVLFLFFA